MVAILGVAAFLRLVNLYQVPSCLEYDEAANVILAGEIAQGKAFPIFIRPYTGKEVLYFYLAAGMIYLSDNPLLREPLLLGLLFLFPIMMLGFYYVAFGDTEQGLAQFLDVWVVNEDVGGTTTEGERWQAGAQLIDKFFIPSIRPCRSGSRFSVEFLQFGVDVLSGKSPQQYPQAEANYESNSNSS